MCELNIESINVGLANVYAPNKDSPAFFINLAQNMFEMPEHRIVVGDFNLVLDNDLDRKNCTYNNDNSKEILLQIMDELLLCDVWRTRNVDQSRYSYFVKRGQTIKASRIDFGLVSHGLDYQIESVFYVPGIMTDHSAFYMSINPMLIERGRGFWKFNNSLLHRLEFVSEMNNLIGSKLQEYRNLDAKKKWETLKFDMANLAQEQASNYSMNRKLIISQLQEKAMQLEEELSDTLSIRTNDLLLWTRADLNDLLNEEIRGVIFRSKAKYFMQAERNTKYFYSLEKARYNAKTCSTLIDSDGSVTNDQKKILKIQGDYYSKLYSSDHDVHFSIQGNPAVKITLEESAQCDQEQTLEEVSVALKQMSNDKCPGLDGLTVNFYKFFWQSIGHPLFEALQQGLSEGKLHDSALRGVINLIPKSNKDTRLLKNLRPLTLLNVDYKILEKSLANRLKINIDRLVHQHQKGFMANRRISGNIRKIMDIMLAMEDEQMDSIVISVDFEKCFDKVEFDAIFGSLAYFGYGSKLIDMIKTTYNGFMAVVQNNGHLSRPLCIQRGVRQGGPIPASYFCIALKF